MHVGEGAFQMVYRMTRYMRTSSWCLASAWLRRLELLLCFHDWVRAKLWKEWSLVANDVMRCASQRGEVDNWMQCESQQMDASRILFLHRKVSELPTSLLEVKLMLWETVCGADCNSKESVVVFEICHNFFSWVGLKPVDQRKNKRSRIFRRSFMSR